MIRALKLLFVLLLSGQSMGQIPQNSQRTYRCPPCDSSCDESVYTALGVCKHCNMVLVREDLSKTIAFYLQDGVEVLDFAGPMEVFSYAGYEVYTVSADQKPIKSQGILTVTPDYDIDNAPKADILAFFGGNAVAAYQNQKVIEWIRNQQNIQYYFSVCTGAFVLAEAGILDGKTATTFHNSLDNLQTQYPKVQVEKGVRYVDLGQVITTAGISAGIDGALHLVAKLQGINAAKRTAYYMEYDSWKMGNGLLLTDQNPYETTLSTEVLQSFEGTYEFKDNTKLTISLDAENRHLLAHLNGTAFPVYHEEADVFSDINSEPVFFKRNENSEIIGYQLAEGGQLFRKLR